MTETPARSAPRFGITRLYRDAGSMAVASMLNAALGIAFWAVAAKLFAPHELGLMTAVLAVITSTGVVLASGIGDAYTAVLPAAGAQRGDYFRRGQTVFSVAAVVSAGTAALGTILLLPDAGHWPAIGALVFIGVVVWATVTLQNSILVALGRANWLPTANGALSLGKLILLPLCATVTAWHPVELSSLLAAALVVLVLQPVINRIVQSNSGMPAGSIENGFGTKRFYAFVTQTTLSSALTVGVFLATPFMVTVFSDPAQGALFALSIAIVQSLDLVGAAMSMSLVVHASSTPEQSGRMARGVLIRVVVFGLVGGALVTLVAPPVLTYLNADYGEMGATAVIAVLAGSTVFRLVYQVWAGLQRARRRMAIPLALSGVSACVLLVALPGLSSAHGALGGAIALLLAQLALAVGIVVHFVANRFRVSGWG